MTDLSDAPEVASLVASLTESLGVARDAQYAKLEGIYRARARELGVPPTALSPSSWEQELDRVVPRKRCPRYSEEYRVALDRFDGIRPRGGGLPRLASSEIGWFVDGKRSVAEIWRLVRAEYGNVTTSSDPWKFAYVVTPETTDISLEAVAAYLRAMEEAGIVEMVER